MPAEFDRSKTLQELEHSDWGEPTYPSGLVETCHRLRRKPLSEFTDADLRILIGQQISLPYLLPLAVERLDADPLLEAFYYSGDLLAAVLSVKPEYWSWPAEGDLYRKMCAVVTRVIALLPSLEENERAFIEKILRTDSAPAFQHLCFAGR